MMCSDHPHHTRPGPPTGTQWGSSHSRRSGPRGGLANATTPRYRGGNSTDRVFASFLADLDIDTLDGSSDNRPSSGRGRHRGRGRGRNSGGQRTARSAMYLGPPAPRN
jgi:hypothetical protein